MSSTRAQGNAEGFHVVIAEDGSLPASELARLGLRLGEHLRLIPEQRPAVRPRMAGALAATVPAEAVDALIHGLDEAKAERVASYRDASDQVFGGRELVDHNARDGDGVVAIDGCATGGGGGEPVSAEVAAQRGGVGG